MPSIVILQGRQTGLVRLFCLLALLVGVSRVEAQKTVALQWLRDSSTYLGSWTGDHLLDNQFVTTPDGIWGWGTQYGNNHKQYTDFQVANGDAATLLGLRLDNRPAPDFLDSEICHFQLQVAMDAPTEESFHTVGTFEAIRASAASLTENAAYYQDFVLPQPVQARYIRLYVLDNYGGNYIQARQFRVFSPAVVPELPTSLLFGAVCLLFCLHSISRTRRTPYWKPIRFVSAHAKALARRSGQRHKSFLSARLARFLQYPL